MEVNKEYKDRIRQAALELFTHYGPRSISMDDIAASIGCSKKTIYQYYGNKDELVEEVINRLMSENHKICKGFRSDAENAIHEIFLALDHLKELFSNMNPVLLNDLKKYHAMAFKCFVDYREHLLYQITLGNLQWGIKDMLYREDIPVDVLARFRVESIMIPFLPDFYSNVSAGLMEAQKELLLHFVYGIATIKGQKLIEKYKKQTSKK